MLADNTLPVVVACFFGVLATHFYFYGAVISDLLKSIFLFADSGGFAGMPCLHVCFCRCCGMFVLQDAIGLMWECMFVSIVSSS